MKNIEITRDSTFLCSELTPSLNTSLSVARFLPEDDASKYPLLSKTPSPPPLIFNHPLRQGTIDLDGVSTVQVADDNQGETSSNSESSGIGMEVQVVGTTTLFNQNVYHNLSKTSEVTSEENSEAILHANLNIPITKDAPSFVYWNWPLIRKCTFFCFIASIFAMIAVVVSMISSLPKTCNPESAWFKGGTFLEISPYDLFTKNNDGTHNDIHQLATRLDSMQIDNLSGIRLNSVFASNSHGVSITEFDDSLGKPQDLHLLSSILHRKGVSLVLDLPINPKLHQLSQPAISGVDNTDIIPIVHLQNNTRISRSFDNKVSIMNAIQLWINYGAAGFYLDGLENFHNDPLLVVNVQMWKTFLGSDKVLIVNNALLERVNRSTAEAILEFVDLVITRLDTSQNVEQIGMQIKTNMDNIRTSGTKTSLQWTLGTKEQAQFANDRTVDFELTSTLLMLMLPGSPNLVQGDQYDISTTYINVKSQIKYGKIMTGSPTYDKYRRIKDALALRNISPSIYETEIKKGDKIESNLLITISKRKKVVIIERWFPRRNTFVSISNLSDEEVSMDLSDLYHSGEIILGRPEPERIYFEGFTLYPMETLIIKLDK